MKNITTLLITVLLIIVSCTTKKTKAKPDYIVLSGEITNKKSDTLALSTFFFSKKIKVDKNGFFRDTIKETTISKVFYFSDGKNQAELFLEKGYDLKISFDANKFNETLKYNGTGKLNNATVVKKNAILKTVKFNIDTTTYKNSLNEAILKCNTLFKNTKGLDSSFIASQNSAISGYKERSLENYSYERFKILIKGKLSTKFIDYENANGEKKSLDDFKGKYVYIDLWATWCGWCIKEFPYLDKIKEEYQDKNIEFVTISVDKQENKELWKKMVVEKNLEGIQLIADNAYKSEFIKSYRVEDTGIPRFILIDPQGVIVSADAPRPSEKELKTLLNSLIK